MNSRTKMFLNYALILGTLLIVVIIGIRGQEFDHLGDVLRAIRPISLLPCLLLWMFYLLMDGLAFRHYLGLHGHRVTVPYALFICLAGHYYSNVTPGASGGQPMQVYYMRKRGIPVGIGSSAVIVQFFCFQLMLAIVSSILWFVYRDFIAARLGSGLWMLVIGYIVNLFGVILSALMALHRGLVSGMGRLGVRIGAKVRLCKDPEAALAKWNEHTAAFHDSISFLIRQPLSFAWLLLLNLGRLFAHCFAVVLIYRALGLTGAHWLQLLTLAMMLHMTAAYIPLPGASGAQEGGFGLYFNDLFPEGTLFVAMLLWRFFTYYIFLLFGAIALSAHAARSGERPQADELTTEDKT